MKQDKINKKNMERILSCIYNNDTNELDNLLADGINVNLTDKDGRTALFYATIEGNYDYVKFLISRGADINIQDNNGCTPLHLVSQNRNIEIARVLIENSAIINILDSNGNTPLSDAVFYSEGHGEMIKILLDAGADKELKNNYGISPYELAISIANYDVAKFFE